MTPTIKQFILGSTIIFIFLVGWLWLQNVLDSGSTLLEIGVVSTIFLVISGVLFILCALFIDKKYFLIFAVISSFLPFLIFQQNIYFAITSAIFFLMFILGESGIKKEKETRTKITFFPFIRMGLPTFLTGFALVLAVAIAFAPQITEIVFKFPKPVYDKLVDWSEDPISLRVSGYHKYMTVDEFLTSSIASQLDELKDNPEYVGLIEQQVKEVLESKRSDLAESLEIEIEGNSRLTDIIYEAINEKMPNFVASVKDYIPIVLILFGFSVIKALTVPLKFIIVILGWALFRALLAVNFLKVSTETIEKEVITL